MRNISETKVFRKPKHTQCIFNNLFFSFEYRAVHEKMRENTMLLDRPQTTIGRMRFAYWVTDYRHTLRLCRLRLKCDGTRAETRFRLSPKRKSPFKSAGASVQSTACSRGVGISGSNAGYIKFRGSVKSTGYPLHSPVSPSLPLPRVTVCHHISTGL